MNLRTVLANIHADPGWWKQVLLGGALSLSIIGAPWSAGLVMESMDNTRKGYPTPLPPNIDWGTRYIIGFFAIIIDFVFFLLPILAVGVLFVCGATVFVFGGSSLSPNALFLGVGGVLGLYQLTLFALGVAPVGRLIYAREGRAEDALGSHTVRETLRPGARGAYAHARIQSLPAYLPAALLALAAWFSSSAVFPGAGLLTLVLLWLTFSAWLYAHLVVAQLYASISRSVL